MDWIQLEIEIEVRHVLDETQKQTNFNRCNLTFKPSSFESE